MEWGFSIVLAMGGASLFDSSFVNGDDGASMACISLEESVGALLRERGASLAVAESCTGGLISHRITSVAGCSDYFHGGIVAYANDVKMRLLGVDEGTLIREGAVSSDVAIQMAIGVRSSFYADIGVSTTGIAGPGGGSDEKPVGLVFVALSAATTEPICLACRFAGSRESITAQAAGAALQQVYDYVISH